MSRITHRLKIRNGNFIDENDRIVILRGINVSGDCKFPMIPDEPTWKPTDFSTHRDVSFVGRPFPLDEADHHFTKLAKAGFNCLRMLVTWEAIEHAGPNQFDTEFLDYFEKICGLAGDHGFYLFIDFHQDVWSRMTGGDGAPGWLFEKVGMDFTRFPKAGQAYLMQHDYDFSDRRKRQEENYPTMAWPRNFNLAPNKIMWTLFYAGNDFAPDFPIDGINAQDYLQGHLVQCQVEVAKRLKDMPHVLGFDIINEPNMGYIEAPMGYFNPGIQMGCAFSPIDSLYAATGNTIEVPWYSFVWRKLRQSETGKRVVNPDQVSIWMDGKRDPFYGRAWEERDGKAEILREDFFQRVDDREVSYDRDYYAPLICKAAAALREVDPNWLVFAGKDAVDNAVGSKVGGELPERSVYASHWYDSATLFTKRFLPFSLDSRKGKLVFGYRKIQKMYTEQLNRFKFVASGIHPDTPVLIGEFGIPFDLNGAKAFKKWALGDRSPKPWRSHIKAMDLIFNAFDALFLSGTVWVYAVNNKNDLMIGDGWNQEDLSLFSQDQPEGRAREGWLRPYARHIAGQPQKMVFDLKSKTFVLQYAGWSKGITKVFVPDFQYPHGYACEVQGGELFTSEASQTIEIRAKRSGAVSLKIVPKR
ncbi:MAG: glycoside hydrolase family 5 protein [Proteobacteria bacterium]|nr:glycoside hydrolase family 5 protein [Pseudomonadota bacterium]